MQNALLQVENLQVQFKRGKKTIVAVDDVSFTLHKGVNLALVGESGSGKSVTSLACMGLLDKNGKLTQGKITFDGRDITHASQRELRKLRGVQMSMIFQEPMTSLNPVLSIGYQLAETLRLHTDMTSAQIRAHSLELLEQMGIPNAETVLRGYPHELSGGMRQRVMIAMALACDPKLLIADEPTTALDVTIQAQILELLKRLQKELGITLLIITHDFGVVAEMADEVAVMYAGLVVESGTVEEIFHRPRHPYTEGLLKSIIPLDASVGSALYSIPGVVPEINAHQECCPFYPRCPYRSELCTQKLPALLETDQGHFVRCFLGGA
jgi:oligopeptide/dipeptide ABC transporter ATP-binding protein